MAPGGGAKRKRGDRSYSGDSRDDGTRPSPHRPDSLSLGQRTSHYSQQPVSQGRGGYNDRGRGSKRGGRGGSMGSHRSPLQSPSSSMQPTTSNSEQPSRTFPSQASQPPPTADQTQPAATSQEQPPPLPISHTEEPTQEQPAVFVMAYDYHHLTDTLVDDWEEHGKEDFVSAGAYAKSSQDSILLAGMFQELIRATTEARLNPEQAGSAVEDIISRVSMEHEAGETGSDNDSFDASSIFLDALSIYMDASPFSPALRKLVEATEIPAPKIRREMDSTLLAALGLIRSTFPKMAIRHQTNRLYRQSNYNLLREETEGYSKLITEFFTTSSNEPPTSEVVEDTFERVKGMVGAFDLDVGRVLDITLDVFAAVLVKQYRFFVKYLRASSWWPQISLAEDAAVQHSLGPLPRWALPGFEGRIMTEQEREESTTIRDGRDAEFWQRCKEVGLTSFFELGGRRAQDEALHAALVETEKAESAEVGEDRKWMETTHTLPPVGNKIAAQVLGFKLRFYSSNARDTSDTFPVNLIYLAALLIKIGFISLRDLYPHIWPDDTAMEHVRDEKLKEKVNKEKTSRPGGGTNALLMAAPLPDDGPEALPRDATRLREAESAKRQQKLEATPGRVTPSEQPDDKPDELPEPAEQKVQLLKSLLCIGAIPEALYMLGRFPWLPDAFTELPEYIHRILHHCLAKVWEPLRPLKDEVALRETQNMPDTEQGGVPKGQVRLVESPARKTMRWAQLDRDDITEAVDYRFYWDDWADIIPVCQTIDDVFTLCSTFLNYSGVKIGQDTTLLLKLVRIGSYSLSTDTSNTNFGRWIDLSKRLLLPALSMTKCNPSVANEVFDLLKCFPEATRYNIYAEWNFGQVSRMPDVKAAFEQTKAETRDILKRISNTTVRPMARALAKVAYSSPGIVFSVAIGQLEAYENIVDTFVECGRYFTFLAYDVLTWSLMNSLSGQGRNSLQADGILTSKWLAALSLFAGKIFKKYSIMNPLPVMQYVEHQLRRGNPTHLIVLEEITRSMAGIISDVSFNEPQIIAMSCGRILRSQMLQQLQDERHKKEFEKSSKRIIKPLTESRIAGKLLISLAQERQTCVFRVEEQNAHPKLLGNVFDQINRVFSQYLDFLRSNLSTNEFDHFIPDVSQLVSEFGIEPGVAFWIARTSLNAEIDDYEAANRKNVSEAKKPELNGTPKPQPVAGQEASEIATDANDVAAVENDQMETTTTVLEVGDDDAKPDTEMESTGRELDQFPAEPLPASEPASAPLPCHPKLQPIAKSLQSTLPSEVWDVLSPAFFVTFWHLSVGDIANAGTAYTDESKRIQDQIKAIGADRTDVSIAGTKRKKEEQETLTELNTALAAEMKDYIYMKHVPRLRKEKTDWFRKYWGRLDEMHAALIERCFFPRLTLSPTDAYYTFRMIKWLHREGATNFKTMGVYDKFFEKGRLTSMVFLCSAKEAECLGRFINDVFRDLLGWHRSKITYEKEAYGQKKTLYGFATVKRDGNGKDIIDFVDFEAFRRLLLKWHRGLNAALRICYASAEYMHVRNAISILNIIHQQFPVVDWMGKNQTEDLTALSRGESREDLKLAITSLLGALKKREKHWVKPELFSLRGEGNQKVGTGNRASSARPSTPSSTDGGSKSLNPSAPEFKPHPPTTTNGDSKTVTGKVDAEDGEIDDAQVKDTSAKTEVKPTQQDPVEASEEHQSQPTPTSAPQLPKPTFQPVQTGAVAASSSNAAASNSKPLSIGPLDKPSSIPSRPEIQRTSSSSIPNGHPDLPNKPEAAQSRHIDSRAPPKSEERPSLHGRDARVGARGGMDGTRDLPNTRPPERPPFGPPSRGAAQGDNRYGRSGSDDGYERLPPRDVRATFPDDRSVRSQSNRSFPDPNQSRRDFNDGERGREPAVAPPSGAIPQHPDRAALIHGHPESDRDRHNRYVSERQVPAGSDRRSRGASPSREGRGPVDERIRPPPDARYQYDDRSTYSHYEEASAPTGPRSGRGPMGPPSTSSERFRDTIRQSSAASHAPDPNHGRLRNEIPSNRQSESYGRLNAENEVPLGPRIPNGNSNAPQRGGRNISAPQLSTNLQPNGLVNQPPASLQQARQAPSGPASSGPPLRSSPRNQHSTQSNEASMPEASPTTDVAGIHPDRLKAMQGAGPPLVKPGPAGRGSGPLPPSPSTALPTETPRGPGNQTSASGPAMRGSGPPTGPADRNRDKRFTGLQSVLQQSENQPPSGRSNQGTSIRGRGGRVNTAGSPSTSGPPTPINARPEPFPHEEPFQVRPNGLATGAPPAEDSRYGRNSRHGPMEPERRSARHRSHSPSNKPFDYRTRDGGLPPPRGDPRDRFGNDAPSMNIRGNAEADIRVPPPAMERELRGGPRRGGREEPHERRESGDWRGGPSTGRRGDERDSRDIGGSLRKRGRGDEGYTERKFDPKRPRR